MIDRSYQVIDMSYTVIRVVLHRIKKKEEEKKKENTNKPRQNI